jgi:hypothetical protein
MLLGGKPFLRSLDVFEVNDLDALRWQAFDSVWMIQVDLSGHPSFPLNQRFRACGFDKP